MKHYLYFFILLCLIGCTKDPIVKTTQNTQLALRQIQSETVDSTDIKYISRVIIQVLQDDGYIIDNLDSDIGYFYASKKLDGGKEEYEWEFLDIYYPYAIYKLLKQGRNILEIKATISIKLYQKQSKIRALFISNLIDENGKIKSVETIDDPKFYNDFFAKISKGLFLENNEL